MQACDRLHNKYIEKTIRAFNTVTFFFFGFSQGVVVFLTFIPPSSCCLPLDFFFVTCSFSFYLSFLFLCHEIKHRLKPTFLVSKISHPSPNDPLTAFFSSITYFHSIRCFFFSLPWESCFSSYAQLKQHSSPLHCSPHSYPLLCPISRTDRANWSSDNGSYGRIFGEREPRKWHRCSTNHNPNVAYGGLKN